MIAPCRTIILRSSAGSVIVEAGPSSAAVEIGFKVMRTQTRTIAWEFLRPIQVPLIVLFMRLYYLIAVRRMDPNTSASGGAPLQNTSPIMDPEELRDTIVRQGAIILSYQNQVEALEKQLRSATLTAPRDPPAARGMYREEETQCAFVLLVLTSRALEWASAVWDADHQVRSSFSYFAELIREVFEYPAGGKDISTQLMVLRQGSDTAADYAIKFRTLVAQSGWNDASLWAVFWAGLNPELQTELACRIEATTLSQFIAMAIRLDNLMRQHQAGTSRSA
ncbi:hypothetical protein QTP70_012114 [Hemibagrus guttatus]|uniref:Retrotransposon gag domain-containing protein n=1 Tax=Hemibagrus guttatus TaxID=175788 RepID=A0AAE0QYR9_9TELE|nr:hypothetical protein QTP70_012114 [Hemibagrus guttatus]